MSEVLCILGPADGTWFPLSGELHHGRRFEVVDAPPRMSLETMRLETVPTTFTRVSELYRIVEFRCDNMERFVAIPDAEPDSRALHFLISRYPRRERGGRHAA